MADRAWIVMMTDPAQGPSHLVFLNESSARQHASQAIDYLAGVELDTIEWEPEDKAKLDDVRKAHAEGRFDDTIAAWDEWRSDMGPLDEDVEIIEAGLFT